jgi:hypothetical protein
MKGFLKEVIRRRPDNEDVFFAKEAAQQDDP